MKLAYVLIPMFLIAVVGAYTLPETTIKGPLSMDNHKIWDVAAPANDTDAAIRSTVTSAVSSYMPLSGGTFSSWVNFGSFPLQSVGTPSNDTDASTKKYVDDSVVDYLPLTGGTLTSWLNAGGFPLQAVGAPVNDTDASTKKYVDDSVADYLPLAGGIVTGQTSFSNVPVLAVGVPVNDTDASTKKYVDDNVIGGGMPISGGTFTGWVNFGSFPLQAVGTPANNTDASTKLYVDQTKTALQGIDLGWDKINKSGDTMTGPLAMGAQKITGLADGTADQDAVTYSQLLSAVSSESSAVSSYDWYVVNNTTNIVYSAANGTTLCTFSVGNDELALQAALDNVTCAFDGDREQNKIRLVGDFWLDSVIQVKENFTQLYGGFLHGNVANTVLYVHNPDNDLCYGTRFEDVSFLQVIDSTTKYSIVFQKTALTEIVDCNWGNQDLVLKVNTTSGSSNSFQTRIHGSSIAGGFYLDGTTDDYFYGTYFTNGFNAAGIYINGGMGHRFVECHLYPSQISPYADGVTLASSWGNWFTSCTWDGGAVGVTNGNGIVITGAGSYLNIVDACTFTCMNKYGVCITSGATWNTVSNTNFYEGNGADSYYDDVGVIGLGANYNTVSNCNGYIPTSRSNLGSVAAERASGGDPDYNDFLYCRALSYEVETTVLGANSKAVT
jgi:hypothetical protein